MFTSLRATRVAAAALTVPLLFAGASCSEDASAETVTSVLDTGAVDDVVTLPPSPEVGQKASGPIGLEMRVDVSADGQDFSIDVQFTGDVASEIVEVTDDGGYVAHSSLTNLEIESSDSDIANEMEQGFPDSVTYEETYDAQGQLVSSEVVDTGLTADELEAVEEFESQTETGSLYPPGVPVGLGATWTATSYLHSSGADIEMAVLNELTSLTETDYTVAMTIDSDIDTELEGEHLTGSVTGDGYVNGSRANSLVLAGAMTIDMELSGGGMSMTLDMYVTYDFTDAAR